MTNEEIARLQDYLCKKVNPAITLRRRGKKDDSVEAYIGDEFFALLFKDDEDPSDISYNLDMAILAMDLDEA
ncbi:MAG: DUF3126 family protein [Robiginitomaculum sp.]|nr:DUF3126 family protein [Robiginitomaculum sp.]MDQ7077924.1 DUF3126 family protein [Robiginitomaculum sp.]